MQDRILSSQRLFSGWLDVLMLKLRMNDLVEEQPIVDHPCGSAVLPYDPVRRVALTVTQTRAAILFAGEEPVVEVIAGITEDEDFAATARREAEEEAGVRLTDLEPAGAVWMDPNSSTERVHLFLAPYGPADRVGKGGGLMEENEQLVVAERALVDLWDEVTTAEHADAKTLLLLQALRLRQPQLFGSSDP